MLNDWRRACQPTPVFLPEESPWTEEPGRRQIAGYSCPWSCKELDTTERLSTAQHAKSNNSDRERQLLYDITIMCYLKNTTN